MYAPMYIPVYHYTTIYIIYVYNGYHRLYYSVYRALYNAVYYTVYNTVYYAVYHNLYYSVYNVVYYAVYIPLYIDLYIDLMYTSDAMLLKVLLKKYSLDKKARACHLLLPCYNPYTKSS